MFWIIGGFLAAALIGYVTLFVLGVIDAERYEVESD